MLVGLVLKSYPQVIRLPQPPKVLGLQARATASSLPMPHLSTFPTLLYALIYPFLGG